MMASAQVLVSTEVFHCYHCGSDSTDSSFKYYDNKKVDQLRHQCHPCHKFFTLGSQSRQQGKTYAKKRNEDPTELKSLSRECCHCGVADHAVFKYYNNKCFSQPRFKCLSCGKQFQMRVFGTGKERRLVHTSSKQTRAPCRRKQGVVNEEDAEFSNLLETELADEDNNNDDPLSQTANGDNGNLPRPWSDEFDGYSHFLEDELFTEPENNEAPNYVQDAFSSTTTNVDFELPPDAWSHEDAKLMDIIEAAVMASDVDMVLDHMAKRDSESTSNNLEVMYGTLAVDRPTVCESDSWSHYNDTSVNPSDSMRYAIDCCHQMDMDVACGNSMRTITPECSSSSACSTMVFPFRVIPEPLLVEQALKEDERCSAFQWNEDDEADDDIDLFSSVY